LIDEDHFVEKLVAFDLIPEFGREAADRLALGPGQPLIENVMEVDGAVLHGA
jgi:hypothetical protein